MKTDMSNVLTASVGCLFAAIFFHDSSCLFELTAANKALTRPRLDGANDEPVIVIPENCRIGDRIEVSVAGVTGNAMFKLLAEKQDRFGRTWISQATFRSDRHGQFNVAFQKPVSGTRVEADCQGLWWSMTMPEPPGKDWKAPRPLDYADLKISLVGNNKTLATASSRQWIIPENIIREQVKGELVAEIFRPRDAAKPLPALLLLGGSGGGPSWARRMGAVLADEGHVTMALAYFNSGDDLPKHLAQVPLEYVDRAIDSLIKDERVDPEKIGVVGYSKGAELALLMASRRPEIKCVAAIAPGSAVFQGFKPPKFPVLSSWTWEGQDIPFVPNNYDDRFFKTYDGMYLWYKTLEQHDLMKKAAIPVEKINGNVLLVSGVDDKIWPATYMSEQLIARLHIAKFKHEYRHLAFPEAGHGIAEPPGHPTTGFSERLGGTPAGNARARESAWKIIREFLSRSL